MNVTTKRFFSIIICFMFQFFMIGSDFLKVYAEDGETPTTVSGSTTMIPLTGINNLFNGHVIWGPGDDWDADFKNNPPSQLNNNPELLDEYKEIDHGIDGYGAFYTFNPDRNGGGGGLPPDGEVTIDGDSSSGDIPFIVKQNDNGRDCIRLEKQNPSTQLCSDLLAAGTKYQNLYILGTLAGGNSSNKSCTVETGYGSGSSKVSYSCEFFDYLTPTANLETYKANGQLFDYTQKYGIRQLTRDSIYRPNDSQTTPVNLQCVKIPITNSSYKTIKSIKITANDLEDDQYLCIFGVTADITTKLPAPYVTSNEFQIDITQDSFTVYEAFQSPYFSISNRYDYISIKSNIHYLWDWELLPNKNYYLRFTRSTNNPIYYYLRVKTLIPPNNKKRTLNLAFDGFTQMFNGQYQNLINAPKVTYIKPPFSHTFADSVGYTYTGIPYECNVSDQDLFKSNIFVRLSDAKTENDPETFNTGWHDLNHIDQLCALNAGTYYVYYYINQNNDTLKCCTYPAESATITVT